ncbi:unnamed protein product, partial [Polarella glacialis]
MDNELFEPLDQFDPDEKDFMIDVINEKVRRILSLDASKYKNGRLPFGLKAYKGAAMQDEGVDVEEELSNLREMLQRESQERTTMQSQLEAARNLANSWKQKFNDLQSKWPKDVAPPEVEETVRREVEVGQPPEAPLSPTSQARKDKEARALILQGMISEEECAKRIAAAEKVLKDRMSELEKRLAEMEKETAREK